MLTYVFLISVIVLLGIVFYNKNSTFNKKWYFYIVSFLLTIIIGFRGIYIGADTPNYNRIFIAAANTGFSYKEFENWDKGFVLLQFIVSRFTDHSYVLFTIIALFYIISVAFFIYRNSSNPVYSYILFMTMGFFTFSLTGIRQVVAFSFILFSYEYIKKRKLFLFILFVILGASFHTTALVFLLAYFIAYKKFTSLYVIVVSFVFSIITIFQNQIFNFIAQITIYDNYSRFESSGTTNLTLLLVIIFIGSVIQKKHIINLKKENIIIINMLVMTMVVLPLSSVNPSALRIAYYFYFFTILLIPEIIRSVKDKGLRATFYFIGTVIVLFLFFKALRGTTYIPYRFFWQ